MRIQLNEYESKIFLRKYEKKLIKMLWKSKKLQNNANISSHTDSKSIISKVRKLRFLNVGMVKCTPMK